MRHSATQETNEKIILITGCSSGIGYQCAVDLRAAGWRVLATARKESDVMRLRDEGFESFVVDYAQTATLEAARDYIQTQCNGQLDALFNNGAYACPGAVEDLPRGALREIFETNLFGVHELTILMLPLMRAAGAGRIINCSSVLGLVPMRWRGAYISTKFALEGLTQTLRIEMRDTGIQVSLIQPGPVTSYIRKNSIPHFEKWIKWETSARKEQYENSLIARLYEDRGPDQFELPATAVSAKLLHAVTARRARPNYYVTFPTYLMSALKRLLPARLMDMIIARV